MLSSQWAKVKEREVDKVHHEIWLSVICLILDETNRWIRHRVEHAASRSDRLTTDWNCNEVKKKTKFSFVLLNDGTTSEDGATHHR